MIVLSQKHTHPVSDSPWGPGAMLVQAGRWTAPTAHAPADALRTQYLPFQNVYFLLKTMMDVWVGLQLNQYLNNQLFILFLQSIINS